MNYKITIEPGKRKRAAEMCSELAEKFVKRRKSHPKETWKRTVDWIAPHLNHASVKGYVNKYTNDKLGSRRNGRPSTVKNTDVDFSILSVAW